MFTPTRIAALTYHSVKQLKLILSDERFSCYCSYEAAVFLGLVQSLGRGSWE